MFCVKKQWEGKDVQKKEKFFQKISYQKKESKGEKNGEETTLIWVCFQVEVHTTQFSLNMQSGSSQSSLKDSGFFFCFDW